MLGLIKNNYIVKYDMILKNIFLCNGAIYKKAYYLGGLSIEE